jgi:hypothetical protein
MKNLLLVFADLLTNKENDDRWIAGFIMSKLRVLSMVLVFSILGLIIIGSALNMVIMDIQRTTESQHQFAMTSVSGLGLGVIVFSISAICLFFRKSFWGVSTLAIAPVEQPPQAKTEPAFEITPIVQALSVLLLDFVEERREKRQRSSDSVEQLNA